MRPFFAEGLIETEDGEKLSLVCDFYTIKVCEDVTGLNWDQEILPALANPPKSLAVQVLFSLLRKRQEHVTLDEAAGLSYDKNAIAIWAVVGDVIRRACNLDFGEDEPAETSKKKPAGRSKRSARNG